MASTPPHLSIPLDGDSPVISRASGGSTLRQLGTRLSIRKKKKPVPEKVELPPIKFISQSEAQEIQNELKNEYSYTHEVMLELGGYSCANAIMKTYPLQPSSNHCLGGSVTKMPVLVVCGKGYGGAVALVCARHLRYFGYAPTIYYPEPSTDPAVKTAFRQTEALEIPALSYLPHEPQLIAHAYELVVDALFDMDFDGSISEHNSGVIQRLRKTGLPICSLDLPAGWNVDEGRPSDSSAPFLEPECLISLIAPKLCCSTYSGKYHFLAWKYVPISLADRHSLQHTAIVSNDLGSYVIDLQDPETFASGNNTQPDPAEAHPETLIHGQE